jgi:hypothetical protein
MGDDLRGCKHVNVGCTGRNHLLKRLEDTALAALQEARYFPEVVAEIVALLMSSTTNAHCNFR